MLYAKLRIIIFIMGGEGMNTAELERELKKNGWSIHHGAAHDQATHPDYPGIKVAIPRHSKDLPRRTLAKIKKATGL